MHLVESSNNSEAMVLKCRLFPAYVTNAFRKTVGEFRVLDGILQSNEWREARTDRDNRSGRVFGIISRGLRVRYGPIAAPLPFHSVPQTPLPLGRLYTPPSQSPPNPYRQKSKRAAERKFPYLYFGFRRPQPAN